MRTLFIFVLMLLSAGGMKAACSRRVALVQPTSGVLLVSIAQGTSLDIPLTMTNNDVGGCVPETYTFFTEAMAFFHFSFSPTSPTASEGQTISDTMTVAVDCSATLGYWGYSLVAFGNGGLFESNGGSGGYQGIIQVLPGCSGGGGGTGGGGVPTGGGGGGTGGGGGDQGSQSGSPVSVVGNLNTPDGVGINGRILIKLARSTVQNVCDVPAQIVPFSPVSVNVTNGALGTLHLYPTGCIALQPVPNKNPLFQSGLGAGTSPPLSVTGNSLMGVIVLVPGSNPQPNQVAVTLTLLSFNRGSADCELIPLNQATFQSQAKSEFVIGQQTTKLTITAGNKPLVQGTSYSWRYACALPYLYTVYDRQNHMLFSGKWLVPNNATVNIADFGGN